MSQQGEKPTGQEDDWWGQLYDDSTGDTGPAAAADSLDDRFASASDTLGAPADAPPPTPVTGPGIPPPRTRTPTERRRLASGSAPAEPTNAAPADGGPVTDGLVADGPAVTGFGTGWPVAGWGPSERQPEATGGPSSRGPAAGGPAPGGPAADGHAPGLAAGGLPPGGPAPGGPASGGSWPNRPAPGGPTVDGPAAAAGPTAGRAAHGPWAGAPRGPEPGGESETGGEALRPGGPESDPLRRSGLQRQRAPWETPPTEPPAPTSFPPSPQPQSPEPPEIRPLSPQLPSPGPESSGPPEIRPLSPQLPSPEPQNPQPPVVQPLSPQLPGLDAAPPRSDTSTEAPGTGAPTSRTPSDASPPPTGASPYASPPPTLVDTPSGTPSDQAPAQAPVQAPNLPTPVDYVGSGPPTYDAEPTALPPADVDELDDLVADTVLDGAAYGTSTLRAVSVRGDSARYRGEPRRDSLLTARFGVGDGALVLVAMATGARATPGAHRAAAEACQWIGRAVGRSHARLAEDIRAARRGDLKSGLHRLTDRSLGKLRATAAEQGIEPEEYTASLRCLLLPADPECRTRVFFGVGAGGLFRLRDGEWQDIEPLVADTAGEAVVGFGSLPHETPDGDRLTMDLGITTPPSPYEPAPEPPPRDPFRFRASVARPGDTLLLCTSGLAEPLRGEPALAEHLTSRWSDGDPPGLAAFLADTLVRVKGYADDRTAAAVWEA
ncbi:protein phosphatase 2C domain-containing protein [Streptomyces phaeochromogenes]|uniref:protein phosphatase 2C domain-containing protein n=1 Tax=Streptomyces phaeochromogenes TaxID=1923 RepID=UPI00225AC98E|nr:protein phosphatase 2C domain-containing protein [Streptomyces phaeochromogenes]MCX5600639.1 protein phosphatase 2C domain-containing protein [Streptomyces phaeochromogenes]